MSLKLLHESFIAKANRPMQFGKLPVDPKEAEVPVLAVDRWRRSNGALTKTYSFRRTGDRERFINSLLDYELDVQHNAVMTVDGPNVSLRLTTHDINDVTELDKEYAAFADVSFKDIVYSTGESFIPDNEAELL